MVQLLIELEEIGCDVQGSLKRFSSNEKMYLKYLYRFPDENTLHNFKEALQKKDYKNAQNEIHTFKGIVGNLGLVSLYELAEVILQLLKNQEYDNLDNYCERLFQHYKQLSEKIQEHTV